MDHQTYSDIRKMLEKGLEVKDTQNQVTQSFKSTKDTANFFPNAKKIVPAYEYSHNLLFQTVKSITSPAPKVLDLGAGIGRLSKLCLEALPDCYITLLDVSEPLLEEASKQLSHFHGKFETITGDFFSSDIDFAPASFDCIISAFAICHGRSESDYQDLYTAILNWMKPEGCFLCLDHVHGATADLTMLGFQDWAELLKKSFSEDQISAIIKHTLREDYPLPVNDHLSLLSDVGFEKTDVLWKEHVFALYGGFGKKRQDAS